MEARVSSFRQRYSNPDTFIASFDTKQTLRYLEADGGRDLMITTDKAPTLNMAKMAFGMAPLKTVVKMHLFQMSQAMGVTSTPEAVDAISEDIISGYGWLKITEIILALRMIREGKFRHGRNGEENRGRMFGVLSSDIICDCINRFVEEYRSPAIDRKINEERELKRKVEESKQATYEQRRDIIFAGCLDNPSSIQFFGMFLSKEDMATLEYYAKERKALCLLKQRVEEYLSMPEADRNTDSIQKGIDYINKNFPFDPVSLEVFQPQQQK